MSDVPPNTNNKRDNNFGFLRLLFATLVIVSHSPELIDGNRSREILTQIFGTMSFGEVAVDGFFLISGYLITQSFVQSQSTTAYLIHRVLRIVPGYLVCFWICVLVIAPFVGAENSVLSTQVIKHQLLRAFCILPPDVPGAFQGLPYAYLNGPMWTIAYEFKCYLATAFLGLLAVYKPRFRLHLLGGVVILMLLYATGAMRGFHPLGGPLVDGLPDTNARFAAVFGVGAVYYLFRDRVRLTSVGALIAAILLFVLLFRPHLAETAFIILGGYLIFWVAFKVRVLRVSRFNNSVDISYGLYLYGWPIQNLIIWSNKTINPFVLCGITLMSAGLLAYASWTLIEEPSTHFVRRRLSVLPPRWTS